jgi:hypothetical protein
MIKQIIKITLTISIFCLTMVSHASTSLKQFEQNILNKYKNADFFEVNHDIENEISNKIAGDITSFTYDFPALQQEGYVRIHYSPDKKIKFYTFDVSGGGTMGEWQSYVQYKTGTTLHVDEFEAGSIYKVLQTTIKSKPVYLVQSYYKGDSCHGAYDLRAVDIGKTQLLKAYIFQGKNKTYDEISTEFDCHKIPTNTERPDYFRITPKTVDVILLNEDLVPQNKYLRYRLETDGYRYVGIVK